MGRVRGSLAVSVVAFVGITLVGPAPMTSAAGVGSPREYVVTFDPKADVEKVTAQVAAVAKAPITRQFGDQIPAATITTAVVPEALDSIPGVLSADVNAEVSAPPSDGTSPADGPSTSTTTTTTTAPGATTTTPASTTTSTTTTTTTTTVPEPDEPLVPWGLDRTDQRALPLSNSYKAASSGAGIRAYVVDTGINPHEQFGSRLVGGADFVHDGLGTGDCDGHGTHVAGTIGGTEVGMAPGVTLVPVRVLDCDGEGKVATIVEAINWILTDHPSGPGVVNMSLGGDRSSASLDLGVQLLVRAGLTVVTAAGNDGVSSCNRSVGTKIAGSIVVGATDSEDARTGFSDYGPCVDLFAPGDDILSAGASSTTALAVKSGTSMAAPHVAGAAAVLLGLDGWRSPESVEQVLVGDATAGVVGGAGDGSPNLLLFSDPGRTATPAPPVTTVVQAPVTTPNVTVPAAVLASDATASTPLVAADNPLAFTGSNPRILITVASISLLLGAFLLVASRRRRELVAVPVATAPAAPSLSIELVRRPRR